MDEIALFHGNAPSKSKAKGWGIWSLHKTFGRWSLEELGKKQHQQGWICLKNPGIWAMMASSNTQNGRNWSNWLSQCFQDQLPASLILTFPAVTLAV